MLYIYTHILYIYIYYIYIIYIHTYIIIYTYIYICRDIPSSNNAHRRGFVLAIPHPEIVGGSSKGELHFYSEISTSLFCTKS